jgi:2-oxoglutarate dehydrogenase E2 component (dihydrolipoamide succinyltransferase)
MNEKILVPILGESITEATVSKWLKNEGDMVEADEPIVELETDKVNLEVPSPISGVLTKIESKDGSVVEVGALLGSVSTNGVDSDQIEKIEDNNKKQTYSENVEENVVNLDSKKKEPDIFDQKKELKKEEPLILTNEVENKKVSTAKSDLTL